LMGEKPSHCKTLKEHRACRREPSRQPEFLAEPS
jgi:hypothetical protein